MSKTYGSAFGGEEIDKAVGMVLQSGFPQHFASGEYKGTGVFGNTNANNLVLGFKPKLLIVRTASNAGMTFVLEGGFSTVGTACYSIVYQAYEKGVSWYSVNHVVAQLNVLGVVYYYYAIG